MSWEQRYEAATQCPSCGRSDEHSPGCPVLVRKISGGRWVALVVLAAFAVGAAFNVTVRHEFLNLGGWVVAAIGCLVGTWAVRRARL